jgi:ParB family chromosome partitioning protein
MGGMGSTNGTGDQSGVKATQKLTHSAALIEDLTAQKTAALRVELANNPDVALATVVHAMLLKVEYTFASEQSVLQIGLTLERLERSMKQADANTALAEWENIKERFGYKVTGNPADLWEWCLDQSREELLSLLAYAAAHTVNAVETKISGDRKQAFVHAEQLGQALAVDMRDYFTPTADSYFKHLNRQSIEMAVAEVRGADFASGIASMKKPEAAVYAEKAVKDSGWLPANIRIAPADVEDAESGETHQFPVAAE